jgi:bile acid:Na+ symporter, BASS family
MLLSVLKIVVAPVALGVAINTFAGRWVKPVGHVFPLVSVAAIALVIAVIVALTADRIPEIGALVVVGVVLHNLTGLIVGYWGAALFGQSVKVRRTIAIEVGMQNSGLAVALASQFFTPAAALPGAVFSIWHILSGSAIAGWWSRRPAADGDDSDGV